MMLAKRMELVEFRYSGLNLLCPKDYYIHLRETFMLDVYKSEYLKRGDVVLDLGSTTGDFCFLASRKVGTIGKIIAIEPNPKDYEILVENIRRNECSNIIPLNVGAGGEFRDEEICFRGNTFKFRTEPLSSIVRNATNDCNIDFIKMDIEGFEYDVVKSSLGIFERARIVTLEFHGTKAKMDGLLLPIGFKYLDNTTAYLCKKLMSKILTHPVHFMSTALTMLSNNPRLLYRVPLRYDLAQNQEGIFTGAYVR